MLDSTTWTALWVVGLSLAAFLVLFWAMRGAPLGQAAEEDDTQDAPGAAYRDRVVAASIVGLLLVGAGAYVAATVGIPWSLPLFAIGFGMMIALETVNRRYRHASPTLRRVVSFSNAALNAALLGGILVVLNVAAFKYGGRAMDFTSDKAFSLSAQSIGEIKRLKRPVTFTAFVSGPAAVRVLQLLNLYRAENPELVKVEALDPFAEPQRFEELRKRVPDAAVVQGGGVAIESGEGDSADRAVVQGTELFEMPAPEEVQTSRDRFVSVFRGEAAITSALIRLRQQVRPLVAFTVGHGEPSTAELDPRRPGLGLFRSRLEATGAKVLDLDLMQQDVASDIALVILAGPRRPFQAQELDRLKGYVGRGGRALVIVGGDLAGDLNGWLKTYNVLIGEGRVYEPRRHIEGQPFATAAQARGVRHPVVDPLAGQYVLLPDAAPLVLVGTDPASPQGLERSVDFVATALLRSSGEAWAELDPNDPRPTRDPQKERPGPQSLGVAVTDLPTKAGAEPSPRLVVLGSPAMVDNAVVAQSPNNLDLAMNATFWLRGRPELASIAPKTHVSLLLTADNKLRTKLVLVPTLIAIAAIVGIGSTIYLARRG